MKTNESGNYTVTHLIPGKYSVKVEQQGYKIAIQEVEVKADVAARTDFSLEIENVTGQVTLLGVVNEGIYFINTEVKQHPVIEFFSFATRRLRQIATMEKEAVLGGPGFAISPDGRWILYAQVDQSGGDIIIMVENFR